MTFLKNEPFLSNRLFKKGCFWKKSVFIFLLIDFWTLFAKNGLFATRPPLLNRWTHKRFIFEESYFSYGKRQKSCTLIVVLVKCLYLTSPIINYLATSNRTFYLPGRKYHFCRGFELKYGLLLHMVFLVTNKPNKKIDIKKCIDWKVKR